jgi:predicted O-methyltransferase YrrM
MSARALKTRAKHLLSRLFVTGQRFGIDLLPRHFYSEIPDIGKLRSTDWWRKPSAMAGVAGADPDAQLDYVRALFGADLGRDLAARDIHEFACARNRSEGFGRVEADVLYAFIVSAKPERIVQIGCGVSTAICLAAAEAAGYVPHITCVEPYPSAFLREQAAAGNIALIRDGVERIAPSCVDDLQAGDFLFVDSTHTLGPAGEVSRIILELLPRLAPGVLVHFHDIYFPYDYPGEIIANPQFFPHESALLHAFLAFNSRFEILASLSMLHHARQAELKTILPNYAPAPYEHGLRLGPGHFPSSTYLRRMGG